MTHIPKGHKTVNTNDIRKADYLHKKRALISNIIDNKANYVNLNRLLSNEKKGYWINLVYIKSVIHKGKYSNTHEYHFEDTFYKKYQLLSSSRSIYEISVVLDKGDLVQLSTNDEKGIEIDLVE